MKMPGIVEVPIVLGFDKKFARPAFVAMQSVVDTLGDRQFASFYVLHEGHDPLMEQTAHEMFSTPKSAVQFLNIAGLMAKMPLPQKLSWDRSAYFRLLIPTIFKGFSKVIWLDADVRVCSPIGDLADACPDDMPIAAARDCGSLRYNPEKPHAWDGKKDDYFNSGILVFNLPRISDEETSALIKSTALPYRYPDQDILNEIFRRKVHYLDQRWNWGMEALFAHMRAHCPNDFYQRELRKTPKIQHFLGPFKPWKSSRIAKQNADYMTLYRRTCDKMDRIVQKHLWGIQSF